MDIQYTILLVFLLNLLLGLFVWSKNKSNKINILSALVATVLAFWALSMFFYVKPFIFNSEVWIKIVYFFVLMMAVTWGYFFKEFLDLKNSVVPHFISLFTFVFILFLFFTDLWVERVIQKPWGPETILGPVYSWVGIFIVLAMAWVLYHWIKDYHFATGLRKMQLLYVFIGMFIFSALATIFDVIIPVATGNSQFFWISPFFSLFFVGANVYAIAEYRLMDIKLVLKKFSVFIPVFGVVIFFVFLAQLIYEKLFPGTYFLKSLFIVLLAIVLYEPVKKWFFKLANRKFFFSYFDASILISEVTESLMGLLESQKIYECVYDKLIDRFHFKAFGVLSYNEEEKKYKIEYNKGFKTGGKKVFVSHTALRKKLVKKNKPIIVEEVKELFADKKIKKLMEGLEKMGVDLIIPLNKKDKIVGLMALGKKESGDMYNDDDLKILKIVSAQIAITLENASMYEKTRDFNERLQEATQKLRTEKLKLKKSQEKLRNKNKELEKALDDFYTLRIGMAEDLKRREVEEENKKVKKRIDKLKK